jgi:uncharacterized protein (TIGR02217 family)
MSNAIFPIGLSGEGWPVKKSPRFSTIVHTSVSGQQTRLPNYPFPLTEFELPFNVLTLSKGDLAKLWGFYLARLGPYDSFLYYDPADCYTVTNAANEGLTPTYGKNVIGTGDGGTKDFQLYREISGALQPVFDINGITVSSAIATAAGFPPPITTPFANVYVNGSLVSQSGNWTLSAAGMLSFSSAPGNGYSVAADFAYFWRVRFQEDVLAFENFVQGLFSAGSVKFMQTYS